jgi:FAD:protein FMN transferase
VPKVQIISIRCFKARIIPFLLISFQFHNNVKSILVFFFITVVLAAGCVDDKTPEMQVLSGYIQGSTYSIKYYNNRHKNPERIKKKVAEIFSDIDKSMSVYNSSSIISRINRNEEVKTDELFNEVFRRSERMSEETGGAFDITVMPLVKAWGFGPEGRMSFDSLRLDSLLDLVGYRKVRLEGNRIVKDKPGISLDVNAIAQGFTVDVICRFFDKTGFKDYLVEVGGEVRAKGSKEGKAWVVGIDRPVDNNMIPGDDLQAAIDLTDRALATSGNYRKFHIENGIKYSHEIDPKTGYPAKNRLLSASIIAPDCSTADAVATACMVMGFERSVDFITGRPELQAYFVYSGDKGEFLTWVSDSLKKALE